MDTLPYTGGSRTGIPTADELRARIPGWGVDLDPADRPSVPRERPPAKAEGVHWDVPEEQPELHPRERSIEHAVLPAAFGSAHPPRGVSGAIRRLAYERYGEARAAHWLLLLAADRVEVKGAALRSLASRRPDNPVTQTGVRTEFRRTGFPTRFGRGRVDHAHAALDPIIVAGPWVIGGWASYRLLRRLVGSRR